MSEHEASRTRMGLFAASAPPYATGVLAIDLKALRRNYERMRLAAPGAEAAAVVKADAYGLGVSRVAPALMARSCRTMFVATLGEAATLRQLAPGVDIYVLDGLLPGSTETFQALGARPVLSSLEEVREWAAFCRSRNVTLPAALHIDTGMRRLGLDAEEIARLLADSEALRAIDLKLIMSHLACADEPHHSKNREQLALFEQRAALFPGAPRSLANSAGVFLGSAFHFDLVRPGIALYGGRAQAGAVHAQTAEPVVWLYGRIAQVQWAERGETVGYGATHTLKRRTRVVTVCVGYADGFFRGLSASDAREGPAAYAGDHRLPLLGRVSMDLITFDATDAPEASVPRGGFVELLGERQTVDDLAAFADTIGYEALTSLGRRYHRIYFDDEG